MQWYEQFKSKFISSDCSTGWIKLMAVTSYVGQVIISLVNYLQNYVLWVLRRELMFSKLCFGSYYVFQLIKMQDRET